MGKLEFGSQSVFNEKMRVNARLQASTISFVKEPAAESMTDAPVSGFVAVTL